MRGSTLGTRHSALGASMGRGPNQTVSTARKTQQRQERQDAFRWLEYMLNKQLIILTHGPNTRSMVASGISIDYLVQLSESLKAFPMLSSYTHAIARDVVTVATGEQKCRFVDVVPHEHVGYATYYVSHNWNGDFHDMVDSLAAEFNRRWQAYVAYRSRGSKDPIDEGAMVDEKRNLVGYYVWIDILSNNQHSAKPMELSTASRLIHVIGRTVLVLDEDCTALSRLWCLYEVWCTLKHKGVVMTHTVAGSSARRESQSGEQRPRARGQRSIAGAGRESSSSAGSVRVVRRESEGGEDVVELAPLDLASAKTTITRDRQLIMAALQQEVDTRQVATLEVVEREVHSAVVRAQEREGLRARQVGKVYEVLGACGKVYAASYLQPTYTDLHNAHGLAQALVKQFYEQDVRRARMLSGEDVELELWESVQFLGRMVDRYKEEDYWGQEFRRYAALAQRSFATRFSNAYVDNLLRQAGTVDDMGVLAQYVHRSCKRKEGRAPRGEAAE